MKDINALIERLLEIRATILDGEKEFRGTIDKVHPNYRYGAMNFIHYLKLRTFDLRKIQGQLSTLGLSSISHSERHVLANVESILHFLHLSQGKSFKGCYPFGEHPVNFMESQKVLRKNTKRLLKVNKNARNTSIMVTLSIGAVAYPHVKDLLLSGMGIARINCSHDNESIWMKMVDNVKQGSHETQRNCSVYFDLAGPKLRTGAIGKKETKKKKKSKNHIKLYQGDLLHLYREEITGEEASRSKANISPEPARISCSIPDIFEDVKTGESIWFDDGKLGVKSFRSKKLIWL